MPTQMNEACTLKIRQIVKNPALELGVSQKEVVQYKKVAAAYGNVAPVVVSAPENNGCLILAGSARLEACAQTGIKEIPAVMVQAADEAGRLKLALMLSSIHDGAGALSEGALISLLINEHGVAPRELVKLLGKSKAWVSKRMALDQNLTASVKAMVREGAICPRSAEEIAKLPGCVQTEFTVNAIDSGLNKTEISQLVARYRNASSDEVRMEIIKTPLEALSKIGERVRKKPADAGLNGPGRRLAGSANYASQMVLKVVNMAVNANDETLRESGLQLSRLRDIAEEAGITLNRLISDVSLGKQGGVPVW